MTKKHSILTLLLWKRIGRLTFHVLLERWAWLIGATSGSFWWWGKALPWQTEYGNTESRALWVRAGETAKRDDR
jgi:hypothetical protein